MDIQALFEAVNCINCNVSSVKSTRECNQRVMTKSAKTKIDRKTAKKVAKKSRKTDQDTIIKIIDEAEPRAKEDGIDIQVKDHPNSRYDELAQISQYQRLLDQYKKFLNNYLKEATGAFNPGDNYQQESTQEREFEWGQEVASYTEIKDTVRKIKMNLLLGGWHNAVSPDEKERYKFWKYVSKFNKVMADVIETSVGSGG